MKPIFYTTGIFAPVITSVTELPSSNVTSVHVSWNQPVGGLAIEGYVVSYCQQEHQSENETDMEIVLHSLKKRGSVTLRNDSSTTVLHLQVNKTMSYVVTDSL